jgi:Reverse transcriptase (RNA-dependent DNA polymerase)
MRTRTDTDPGRAAIDAVRTARQRCWRADWVVDLDIERFFDSIDHELVLKALRKHTDCRWVLLYVERWLKAPMQSEEGRLEPRTAGTPQGGVVSPLLANLFLHYVFDRWMVKAHPRIVFERYADDIICHCRTEGEAVALLGYDAAWAAPRSDSAIANRTSKGPVTSFDRHASTSGIHANRVRRIEMYPIRRSPCELGDAPRPT